ncbi:winged helix-turn-helix transcriptional regulator [Brachybacterium sp. DNPG3]
MTIAFDPFDRTCPSRGLLDRIGDRWTVLVILTLQDGPHRFSVIRRRIDGVSQKMLTQTLRSLESDGLVTRTVYPEVPPHVEYELSPLGRTLLEPLGALFGWASANMPQVLAAREAAAAREPTAAQRRESLGV